MDEWHLHVDWHLLVIVVLAGMVVWLWRGRIKCRRAIRDRELQHFVRGTVFCMMHRKMFPNHQVPVGVAFDPNHREQRDRVLVEWGAVGGGTPFDLYEWEASIQDDGEDRSPPFDDPETGGP